MAKAILICGKICSGKTWYALSIMKQSRAVLLSADELMGALFHDRVNEVHDELIKSAKRYLLHQALVILNAGADVILDWGFWTREERENASHFFAEHGMQAEWHYIDIDEAKWQRRINKRNRQRILGQCRDYYVDGGLLNKMNKLFEAPRRNEMDRWLDAEAMPEHGGDRNTDEGIF